MSVNEWSRPSDRQDDGAGAKQDVYAGREGAGGQGDKSDNESGILCLGQGTMNQTHKESTVCLMSEKKPSGTGGAH